LNRQISSASSDFKLLKPKGAVSSSCAKVARQVLADVQWTRKWFSCARVILGRSARQVTVQDEGDAEQTSCRSCIQQCVAPLIVCLHAFCRCIASWSIEASPDKPPECASDELLDMLCRHLMAFTAAGRLLLRPPSQVVQGCSHHRAVRGRTSTPPAGPDTR
jgi:hypothetical protein